MEHKVLFTGGFDSTYRLCQLALDKDAVVQPVYVLFPDDGKSNHIRPEIKNEIKAQDRILDSICRFSSTKARFLPIKRINRDEIPLNLKIKALEEYLSTFRLGWQYLYFTSLSEWFPYIELCHEGFPETTLDGKLYFKTVDGRNVIDESKMEEGLSFAFRNFSWPIYGTERKDMLKFIKESGYMDVMNHVWWCYKSIDGKPCGVCDNCRGKIESGLRRLFTKEAVKRFLIYKFLESHYSQTVCDRYRFQYLRNYEATLIRYGLNTYMTGLFKLFHKLSSLTEDELKRMVIYGTFEYGYRPAKKDKILGYKTDVKRRHMFDYL